MNGTRLHSAAAERNRGPILDVLRRLLPPRGTAIEVAAGSGQHAAFAAAALAGWRWHPSDASAEALASIDDWCAGLPNVAPAVRLDVLDPRCDGWPGLPQKAGLVLCVNMLHVSPWAACAALMRGAAGRLGADGVLVTYGPYRVDGEPTAPGNVAFDADLRARDPAWGLRRLADVSAAAADAGLALRERVALPANNQLLVFAR